jgi:hypothetical protein
LPIFDLCAFGGSRVVGHTIKGPVSGTYTFTLPGIYRGRLNITDDRGATNYVTMACDLESVVVIFDASGGHPIGVDWITSPAGAYADNPGLALNSFLTSAVHLEYIDHPFKTCCGLGITPCDKSTLILISS